MTTLEHAEVKKRLYLREMTLKDLVSVINYSYGYLRKAVTTDSSNAICNDIFRELGIDTDNITDKPELCQTHLQLVAEIQKQKHLRGLGDRNLADLVGIHRMTLMYFYRKQSGIKVDFMIADILGIPLSKDYQR